MCGRFGFWADKNTILAHYGIHTGLDLQAAYNITPSSIIPMLRLNNGQREWVTGHWGLIPKWAKDRKLAPINARAESLAEKPFFRDSFAQRRCLIPASGYYEWQGSKGRKQPYLIKVKDAGVFSFAGLWSYWDQEGMTSCAIITTPAGAGIKAIHDRMPAIIDPENYDSWLEKGGGAWLTPYAGALEYWPVSPRVNSPKNQDADLIQRV